MKNIKAFLYMGSWTLIIAIILYSQGAHIHFRELNWAIGTSLILLITHMVNMAIYFKVAGNEPYKWFK
ncbi:MAG: hypothetical protein P8M55_00230 [Gammaproteobacteria bacterium]|jgi:NhaP-type Na+/H+ or K+/H+ antiporter|nr:hypothetical protein [Gammaproteobacteria bacterium]MBT5439907.1 hypothetical protein [Candidatus Neomarinimicrobiota bacterium]MDG2434047.1 hypothetical protein [Gammaproteobacteria bacterium]